MAKTPAAKTPTHYKPYAFGDTNVKGGFENRPERFQGKTGMTYRLRIMTTPVAFFGANVKNKANPDKGFFAISLADFDDCHAALFENDAEAMERCKAACPLFAKGYDVDRKFAVMVWIAEQSDGRNKAQKVQMLKPWTFGNDKYASLTTLVSTLPEVKPGQKIPLNRVEIVATCTEGGFQKFNFAAVTQADQMTAKYKDVWELCKGNFDGDNPDDGCPDLRATIEPDSLKSLIRSLTRLEGGGGGETDSDPDLAGTTDTAKAAAGSKTGKPAGGATAAKPAAKASEEGDELEKLLGEGGGDLDLDT